MRDLAILGIIFMVLLAIILQHVCQIIIRDENSGAEAILPVLFSFIGSVVLLIYAFALAVKYF